MNKKLLKKYSESEKIEMQIQELQEKLQGVNEEAVELEKTELHKIFISSKITFEEYTQIVTGILSKDEARKTSLDKKENYLNNNLDKGEVYNEG